MLIIAFLIGGFWGISKPGSRSHRLLEALTLGLLAPTPIVILLALLGAVPEASRASEINIILVIGIVGWPGFALRLYSEVCQRRDAVYLDVARLEGARPLALLFEEILPELMSVLMGLFILATIGIVSTETLLGFLGVFNNSSDTYSLGTVLAQISKTANDPEKYVQYQGLIMLFSVTIVIGTLLGGLKLIESWLKDRRINKHRRSISSPNRQVFEISGWEIDFINHKSTRQHLVKAARIPYRPGECVCVSGPSGSGKSISCLSIAGELPIELNARIHAPREGLKVRMLPQGQVELFAKDISINTYFESVGIRSNEIGNRVERFDLSESELKHEDGTWKKGNELSGGMAKRVSVSLVSCMPKVDVLIFDEPAAGLDAESTKQLASVFKKLINDFPDTAIIIINHEQTFTQAIADHIVYFDEGTTLLETSAETFFSREARTTLPSQVKGYLEANERLKTPRSHKPLEHGDPVIQAKHLCLGRDSSKAIVDDFNLEVLKGERVALSARSGVGKSTIFEALAGLPDVQRLSGEVKIFGQVPTHHLLSGPLRLTRQSPSNALNPYVPIKLTLQRAARRLKLSDKRTPQEWALFAADQACFPRESLDKLPSELSGGLQIRAGLARCMIGEPEVILLDEITAGLDPVLVLELLNALDEHALKTGMTLLLISHEESHLHYLGARVINLKDPSQAPKSSNQGGKLT
ncbi:ATP-binding cassette domain-containing protein [Myxococcota bacterium]|nr:ATP-binding cassette domain-containing protein [Myxococcota bacterium]